MKKVGKWILFLLYGGSPLFSTFWFYYGIFAYGLFLFYPKPSPSEVHIALLTCIGACIVPWLSFALGVVISKVYKAKALSKAVQIATGVIFLQWTIIDVFLLIITHGTEWIWNATLPFLFCCVIPHITFSIWNATRPKKLPWILSLVGLVIVAVGLLVVTYINLVAF